MPDRTQELAKEAEQDYKSNVEEQAKEILRREYERVERARVAYKRLESNYESLKRLHPEEIVEKRGSISNLCAETHVGSAHNMHLDVRGALDVDTMIDWSKVRGGR